MQKHEKPFPNNNENLEMAQKRSAIVLVRALSATQKECESNDKSQTETIGIVYEPLKEKHVWALS